jgi:NAD(P)-dependent dehydrogenase (short-subunit alcohol dehydrogenase family)
MDLHLSDTTAVVTGASKGIGLAITQALVDAGAYVVAGSRSRGTELGALEDAGKVTFVSADLSHPDGADDLIASAPDL